MYLFPSKYFSISVSLRGSERYVLQWGESQKNNATEQEEIKREKIFMDKPREQCLLNIKDLWAIKF